jgi:hypothetical protein
MKANARNPQDKKILFWQRLYLSHREKKDRDRTFIMAMQADRGMGEGELG